jgi:nucleoside-diphosphate-sugar epimerase
MSLLIVGCGYVGHALLDWIGQENSAIKRPVYVLTRSTERADQLQRRGVQPLVGHWLDSRSLPPPPPTIDQLLVSVPHRPDPASLLEEDSDRAHVLGLRNLLSWLGNPSPGIINRRLVYLSTTGVYGQQDSAVPVSEQTPPTPTRIGPKIAVAAENFLDEGQPGWSTVILRLAGIYGPDRIPLAQRLRDGLPLAVPKDGYLNLIHVQDIARAIEWLFGAEEPESMYLLSDGQPVQREEFYRHLAGLCGIANPEFTQPEAGDPKARRATDKRVDSNRFWKQSGLTPAFPNYQSGLRHSLGLD